MSLQDGHNIKWLGIKKETTYNTNPIPDFTDDAEEAYRKSTT